MAVLLAACVTSFFPAPARAAGGSLAAPCLLATPDQRDPAQLLANPRAFDCHRPAAGFSGPVTWALFEGLNIVNDPANPLLFRHSQHRFSDEAIFVRYADGHVATVETDAAKRRQALSSGILSFRLPESPDRITALLVREEGLQNQRGIAPNAAIMTSSAAAQQDTILLLFYALCSGAVLALVVYNLSLYFVLRYTFILAYSASAFAVFLFGLVWSGGIFLFLPAMSPATLVSLVLAAISLYGVTIVWFMLSFIERDRVSKLASRCVVLMTGINCGSSAMRLIDDTIAWRLVDQVYYVSLAGMLVAMIACTISAMTRGSLAARFYLSVWTAPILFAFVRILWGTGFVEEGGILAEISPQFILAFETMISSLAVGWRIGQVRDERDEARGREKALKILAETDPLSGLLNRRAFLERVREGDHGKRLILVDIDRFKAINDAFGHDVGDQVIRAVADTLVGTAPETALVGRIGGEEFAVLVNASTHKGLAEKLCRAVAQPSLDGGPPVTISAGVSEGMIADEQDWRLLYIAADQALYEAKRGGRNRVHQSFTALAEQG